MRILKSVARPPSEPSASTLTTIFCSAGEALPPLSVSFEAVPPEALAEAEDAMPGALSASALASAAVPAAATTSSCSASSFGSAPAPEKRAAAAAAAAFAAAEPGPADASSSRGIAKICSVPWASDQPQLSGLSSGRNSLPPCCSWNMASSGGIPWCAHHAFIILPSGVERLMVKSMLLGPSGPSAMTSTCTLSAFAADPPPPNTPPPLPPPTLPPPLPSMPLPPMLPAPAVAFATSSAEATATPRWR
mmetsp:Transcript_81368/g.214664  ORF Transcript_81368/g.214664 Transcript_81368/m.214664 type:complete len:248 (-) Transcript_81368:18-761(-)